MYMPQIEKWKTALNARKHVEIQPRVAQGSATFAVAVERAACIAEANEYVALIRRADGSHEFEGIVTRSEARELMDAGAIFSGHPLQRP